MVVANEELPKANDDLETSGGRPHRASHGRNQKLKVEMAAREESHARSLYLAYHNSLTGLGNRLLFKEQLEEALRDVSASPHPLAVFVLGSGWLQGDQ